MRMTLPLSTALIAVLLVAGSAFAQWSDNFDGYPANQNLHNVGGWTGWGNDPGATAFVRAAPAPSRSAPHSVEIALTSDLVQQYAGVNAGQWVMSGWCYIPTGATGRQYFILMNTYTLPATFNWSTQLRLDMTANVARDDLTTGNPTKPLARDRWVEVRVEIDFAIDQQQLYYDGGAPLSTSSWRRTGALNLAALDLFGGLGAQGQSIIHWDDLVLRRAGVTAVEPATWGGIKATFNR